MNHVGSSSAGLSPGPPVEPLSDSEPARALPSGSLVEIRTRKPQFPVNDELHAYLRRYQ